jgi:hypothetical protein
MSDTVVPGTLVHMRVARRYSHYTVGEMIAVPYEVARDLDAKRLAVPLQLFVPGGGAEEVAPLRQPTGVVRK